jgi:hypothetical protein
MLCLILVDDVLSGTPTIPSATVKVPTLRAAAVRGIPQLIYSGHTTVEA